MLKLLNLNSILSKWSGSQTIDESKAQFDTALSTGGSDDTICSEQGRTVCTQQLIWTTHYETNT